MTLLTSLLSGVLERAPLPGQKSCTAYKMGGAALLTSFVFGSIALYYYVEPISGKAGAFSAVGAVFALSSVLLFIIGRALKPKIPLPKPDSMIEKGLQELNPPLNSVVMIENVGNLVCPALFDLGEAAKVVILSVTEGEDKPIKYPHIFRNSEVMILTKIDLLPYLQFDVQRCIEYAKQVNPKIQIFQVSATTGEGLEGLYSWLSQEKVI